MLREWLEQPRRWDAMRIVVGIIFGRKTAGNNSRPQVLIRCAGAGRDPRTAGVAAITAAGRLGLVALPPSLVFWLAGNLPGWRAWPTECQARDLTWLNEVRNSFVIIQPSWPSYRGYRPVVNVKTSIMVPTPVPHQRLP